MIGQPEIFTEILIGNQIDRPACHVAARTWDGRVQIALWPASGTPGWSPAEPSGLLMVGSPPATGSLDSPNCLVKTNNGFAHYYQYWDAMSPAGNLMYDGTQVTFSSGSTTYANYGNIRLILQFKPTADFTGPQKVWVRTWQRSGNSATVLEGFVQRGTFVVPPQ